MLELAHLGRDEPAKYRICLMGVLDSSWSAMLGPMTLEYTKLDDGSCVTTLTGWLIDQAALMGVLNLVYDLGFPLLLVEHDSAAYIRSPPVMSASL